MKKKQRTKEKSEVTGSAIPPPSCLPPPISNLNYHQHHRTTRSTASHPLLLAGLKPRRTSIEKKFTSRSGPSTSILTSTLQKNYQKTIAIRRDPLGSKSIVKSHSLPLSPPHRLHRWFHKFQTGSPSCFFLSFNLAPKVIRLSVNSYY